MLIKRTQGFINSRLTLNLLRTTPSYPATSPHSTLANKPPSKSNRSSTNHRLHHTGSGAAAEEEPTMMIHSHSANDRMRPVVHLQPNLIARLMGIDDDDAAVPKPAACTVDQAQVQTQRQTTKGGLLSYYSYVNADADPGSSSSRLCLNRMMMMMGSGSRWRPRPRRQRRRHPQEEELLQKMRQDLRAWQAPKAVPALLQMASSSSCGRPSSDDSHDGGRSRSLVLQAIAQEDLRRQKMARYRLAFGLGHTKVTQHDELLPLIKNKSKKKNGTQGECDPSSELEHDHEDAVAEPAATAMPDDSVVVISPSTNSPRVAAPTAQAQELPSRRHTPIVLLKPTTCSDTATGAAIGGGQKTKTVLLGLPKLHRDASMSMLLQEVKDRVQRELTLLTAATTTTTTTKGELIKTPVAIPLPSQQVTKEDRGNKRLFRSESFRAFRRDRKRNASPEAYIPTNRETAVSPEKADEESVTDAPLSVLRPGLGVGVTDGQSFRSECLTTKHRDDASPSPRMLFRSLSAPEPGFSFSLGRLFSFKQHEASEPAAAGKSVVSAGFSFIRGTVSSLRRHGFSSRRKLMMFRRKTHWSWSNKTSVGASEIHPAKMEVPICAATPPSQETFSLFKVARANLSELPPSPVSPLEVAAGHSSRHFFTDLHFTLPVSPKCLSEMEPPVGTSESSFRTDITAVEAACSRDKAYITELLIAAGLYHDDGPSANARVDSMARTMPICDDVFEDVEDMYYYRGDYIVGGGMYDGTTDHRMLFDLANEALQRLVVESSRGGSSLRRWVVDSTGVSLSRGKKLVDDVWQQVQALRNPQAQEMQTIDGMVAYEVRRSVWAELLLYEDVCVVGRKIERAIFDELIEDFLACAGGFHMKKLPT